jgi:D-beta-D-heptose 7-phosphate kinase/D-beta-D-heptose 1-phosphate adenosyltransferase
MKNLENFSKVKVLIVGDVMLDRFWWGNVTRISPEAPVPVMNLRNTSVSAGGAANVAANIAGLGAQPFLVGAIGDDQEAELFPEILADSNVSADFLIKITERQTTVKTRIIAHSQQIVRIDQETKERLNENQEAKLWNRISDLINEVKVIVLSDYAKGVLTDSLLLRLITTAREENKLVLVDPKGKNFSKYKYANLLTPNRREVAEACKLEEDERDLIEDAGKKLVGKLQLEALLITEGEDGVTLVEKNKQPRHLKALARDVYDVTGAGDTVIACLAAGLGSGMSYLRAAKFANLAAGLVVEHIGTTPISLKMLKNALSENNRTLILK